MIFKYFLSKFQKYKHISINNLPIQYISIQQIPEYLYGQLRHIYVLCKISQYQLLIIFIIILSQQYMSNTLINILDNFIDCLSKLDRRVKRAAIEQVSFETYLSEIKEIKQEFEMRCQFYYLIDQMETKNQISEILENRIQMLKNLEIEFSDECEHQKKTSKSYGSTESDQSLRSILKSYINTLKTNEVKLCELNQRINNNKQNELQIQYLNKNKQEILRENLILSKLSEETKKIDKIVEKNLRSSNIKFELIKKLSDIEESFQSKSIYLEYRSFRKWQTDIKRIFESAIMIIEKYMITKNMNIHMKRSEKMFEENTSYSCGPQSPKKSVLTQRLIKITSEIDFFEQLQNMEEVKPSLDFEFDVQCKKKQKKVILRKDGVCYNGCRIF